MALRGAQRAAGERERGIDDLRLVADRLHRRRRRAAGRLDQRSSFGWRNVTVTRPHAGPRGRQETQARSPRRRCEHHGCRPGKGLRAGRSLSCLCDLLLARRGRQMARAPRRAARRR